MKRDPIVVLRSLMEELGEWSDEDMTALDDELKAVVEDAWTFADASPEPQPASLYEDVYVDTTSDAPLEAGVAAVRS
jgi:TPP-dependent pyruvate/acetoin dehydrogenase alpha subunit